MTDDAHAHIPQLRPFTRDNVHMCGHALAGEPIVAALSLQAAEGQSFDTTSTLCCARCALAGAEAIVAALRAEWALRKQ